MSVIFATWEPTRMQHTCRIFVREYWFLSSGIKFSLSLGLRPNPTPVRIATASNTHAGLRVWEWD